MEAESESRAYRQPSCSPSDPAGTCWTAARRACSLRRWEPTSCPGSDRRQMSTPPGTSRRWAGWCPADATLASWSYRGSSGRCATGTPSAPCWGGRREACFQKNITQHQRRLNHHLRNQKMIMSDCPMLGWWHMLLFLFRGRKRQISYRDCRLSTLNQWIYNTKDQRYLRMYSCTARKQSALIASIRLHDTM